jgi:hypothetical protein
MANVIDGQGRLILVSMTTTAFGSYPTPAPTALRLLPEVRPHHQASVTPQRHRSGTGTDVMSDTPTTNWATLNPLDAGTAGMLSDGNLTYNLGWFQLYGPGNTWHVIW